jgi:RNA polymerase sigma factor (TIGR02999 family)
MSAPPLPAQFDETVTGWLSLWKEGDRHALEHVMAVVYQDLRRMAAYYLSGESNANTLQPTALVHEAYLRLAHLRGFDCNGREHFIAVVARAMRRVLVDHSRARNAAKRNAGAAPSPEFTTSANLDPLEVDRALDSLSEEHPRKAQVVELRFFGGLEFTEIATALDISLATAERDWRFARAWLQDKLGASAHSPAA